MADTKLDQAKLDDIEKKLDGIVGWVQSQKAKSELEGKPWSWLIAVIAAILVFFGLAFIAYTMWNKGREVAKLKHELDLQKEEKQKAEIEIKLNAEESIQQAQKLVIESADKKIAQTIAKIESIEKERLAAHEKINQVTTWADIDNLTK